MHYWNLRHCLPIAKACPRTRYRYGCGENRFSFSLSGAKQEPLKPDTLPRMPHIAAITLDDASIIRRTPEVEHERRVAMADLVEEGGRKNFKIYYPLLTFNARPHTSP